MSDQIVVVGGGAAGYFAAITCAQLGKKVTLIEKTKKPLAKVQISGGGRCNVTHACFDNKKLVQNYPRGRQALLGPFSRFSTQDTIRWFEERHVRLKTEADGRMFPTTDSSDTIVNCLKSEAANSGVTVRLETAVTGIERTPSGFCLHVSPHESLTCTKIILATGSNRSIFNIVQGLGHTIVEPVPSLFTFNIANHTLQELAGVSVARATVSLLGLTQSGPLLITHWGFSGPAVLKLSSFGARALHACGYKTEVQINWLSDISYDEKQKRLLAVKEAHPKRQIGNECPFELPNSLWRAFLAKASIDPTQRLADLSKRETLDLLEILHRDRHQIHGQTTYKEEFVTCGGVSLDEVNFKTMESKLVPGLHFAGEILDIDGITGGFNFQNAWTSAWLAAHSL